MKVVIPMAGTGNRFVEKNYKDPKPLIRVNGKRIIEYILEMFDVTSDDFVFICNDNHVRNTEVKNVLLDLVPNSKIVSMPQHKKGPVYTVKSAYEFIGDDEEVVVSYCDNPCILNRQNFQSHVKNHKMDGCILTHTGFHPHALASTKMAFVKEHNEYPLIMEIKEKQSYTDKPTQEHASTGIYHFKNGAILKKYFDLALEKDLNYNGECYVTLVYNLLIQDGLRVGYFDTPFVTVFGTPEEVENFESWSHLLRGGQIKNAEDVANCYNYWKTYHATGKVK